jgi:hypothetical protein
VPGQAFILPPMTLIRRLILAFVLMAGIAPAMAQAPAPVPALPDTERRTSYSITGTTCACNVNFALYGDGTDYQNWVEVYLNGTRVNYNDATFGWTITSPSGTIGSLALPITDAKLTFNSVQTGVVQIVGARRPRRVSQFSENQGVPARNLNQVLTDIIAQNREIWDKTSDMTGRGLFFAPGNTTGPMPSPSLCASAFLSFDATGLNPQCHAGGPGSGNVVGPATSIIGDVALFSNTTGSGLQDGGPIRTGITTPVTLYVNPSSTTAASCNGSSGGIGSDSNAGTLAAPFLTPNHAINVALTNYDVRQSQVTIQYCDNNVTGATYPVAQMNANMVGAVSDNGASGAQLIIQGNSSTPSNVIVQGAAGANGISLIGVTSPILVRNMQIGATLIGGATTGHGIGVDAHSMLLYSNIVWGFTSTSYAHVAATYGSFVEQEGVEKIIGGAALHWYADRVSQILLTGQTITCTGTPAFASSFVAMFNGSVFTLSGSSFSGCSGVTGTRYQQDFTSSFGSSSTDPNSVFPGNANGSVAIPSFYYSGIVVGNGGPPTGASSPMTTMPALNGDCTLVLSTGVITCIKTNGSAFGALATVTPGAGVATALAIAPNTAGGFITYPQAAPNIQVFTSGTNATYTTPTSPSPVYLEIEFVGGGGGGAGSGTSPGAAGAGGNTCWNTSGTACSSPLYQGTGGGAGATGTSAAGGGVAGSLSCADSQTGGTGGAATGSTSAPGGMGGVSRYGGAGAFGPPAGNGLAAIANTGSGGGGAGDNATANTGGGGGAGGWCYAIISSPAASYVYTVGAAGAAGTNGTGGTSGGGGAAGKIRVIAHFD